MEMIDCPTISYPIIDCKEISFKRDGKLLFRNLSFKAIAGNLTIITGANGSGKTSLLKIIATLLRPCAGAVFYKGRNLADDENLHEYFADMVFICHQNALDEELSARQNLLFYADVNDARSKVMDALKLFQLEKYSETKVKQFSAGMKRKLALARLKLSTSQVIILDEPLTNLDELSTKILLQELQELTQQGKVIILSSHVKTTFFEDFGFTINHIAL